MKRLNLRVMSAWILILPIVFNSCMPRASALVSTTLEDNLQAAARPIEEKTGIITEDGDYITEDGYVISGGGIPEPTAVCISIPADSSIGLGKARLEWSPDGETILFTTEYGEAIYLLTIKDALQNPHYQPQRLTNEYSEFFSYSTARWSPDGRTIVYVKGNGIHLMSNDGEDLLSLGNGLNPTLSPNGLKVLFENSQDNFSEIYSANVDSGELIVLATAKSGGRVGQASWSPDGQSITYIFQEDIFQAYAQIYTVNSDGTQRTRLSEENVCDSGPVWSPDGKHILFASTRTPSRSNRVGRYNLFQMDSNGTNIRQLTDVEILGYWNVAHYTWSLDAKKIATVLAFSDNDEVDRIFVWDIFNEELELLFEPLAGECCFSYPSWSPDGERLAFLYKTRSDGRLHIDLIRSNGSERIHLITLPELAFTK